jgi:hypothetical protein
MSIKKIVNFLGNIKFVGYYKNRKLIELNRHNNLFEYKIETYLNIYNRCIENDKVLTHTKICFSPNISFGSSIREVKKNNPNEFNILENTKDWKTLIYKIKVGEHKFRLEMHFFKNKLVFFNYILRTLQDKKNILKLITNKYLSLEDYKSLDFSKITFTDGLRNYIDIDNSVLLSVRYFTYNYGFFDYLKKMQSDYRGQKVKLHNYVESELFKKL